MSEDIRKSGFAIAEQNPNPVFRVTLEGRLIYANPPARALFKDMGATEAEPIPEPLRPLAAEAAERGGIAEKEFQGGRDRTFRFAAVRPESEAYVNLYGRDITKRREAEQKTEYQALLLARVHDAVIGADEKIRITYWNKGAERMFGFAEAEALGRTTLELLRPSYRPGDREKILEDLERRDASRTEVPLKRKDGSEMIVEAHTTRLTDAGGRTSGYVIVYRDVTERRRAEAALQESHEEIEVSAEELRQQNEELLRTQLALQESEDLFRVVASSTPDHVLVQDSDLRYTMVINPQMGLSERDMIGKTDNDFLARKDAENLTAIKRNVLKTGKSVRMESPLISPSGAREYFDGSYVPRFDPQGRVNGLIGYFRNVTERRRAEDALQESHEEIEAAAEELREQNEELLRIQLALQESETGLRQEAKARQLALDAARMGWWHYDPMTRVSAWDDRYKEIFGVTGHEGPNDEILTRIIHPDDLPALWAKVEAALDPVNPQPYAAEYRIRRPDGPTRWIEAHGIAAFEGTGAGRHAASLVGTVADITERKQAEDALQSALQRLRILIASLRSGILLVGADDRIAVANQALCGLFALPGSPEDLVGITADEMIEKIKLAYLHPDVEVARLKEIVRRGQPVLGEEIALRDGRSCLRDFVPVTAGGKSFGRLWQHTDITENKRAQEELERRADEMRAVNEELSRFNRAMVGRETRMIELKKEVNELCARLGEPRKYEIGSREQDDQQGRR